LEQNQKQLTKLGKLEVIGLQMQNVDL